MPSETLRNIRTMRQVKSSLDMVKNQRVKTTNSLSRTAGEAAHLKSLVDKQVGQLLAKERKRFATQQATVDKSRQGLLRAREKLAATINKNRALAELRHELQQSPLEIRNPTAETVTVPSEKATTPTPKAKMPTPKAKASTRKAKVPTRKPKLRQVELKY